MADLCQIEGKWMALDEARLKRQRQGQVPRTKRHHSSSAGFVTSGIFRRGLGPSQDRAWPYRQPNGEMQSGAYLPVGAEGHPAPWCASRRGRPDVLLLGQADDALRLETAVRCVFYLDTASLKPAGSRLRESCEVLPCDTGRAVPDSWATPRGQAPHQQTYLSCPASPRGS